MPKFETLVKNLEEDQYRPLYESKSEQMVSDETNASFDRLGENYAGNEVIDRLDERFNDESTFETRTNYYFQDNKMNKAKVTRYRNMSKDKRASKAMNTEYGTRGGYKRRKAAGKAADKYEKANKLASRFSEEGKTPMQIYKHREKMMKLRLEGRIAAAEAKAKSPEHEKYLKAKAKVSILMVLQDQLIHLKEEALDKKMEDEFAAKEETIQQEIKAAKEYLEQVSPSSNVLWQKQQKDGRFACEGEAFNSRVAVANEKNSNFGEQEGQVLTTLQYMHEQKVQWPKRVVFKNGMKPVNSTEQEKRNWNYEYDRTVKNALDPAFGQNDRFKKAQQKYMEEAMRRVEKFKIPNIDKLDDMGKEEFIKLYNRNLGEYYEMIHVALPHLKNKLNSQEDSFEKRYIKEHKEMEQKLKDLQAFADFISFRLLDEYGIYNTKEHKISELPKGEGDIGFWFASSEDATATINALNR